MASPFSPTEARSPLMRDKKSDSAPAEKPAELDAAGVGGGGATVVVGTGGAVVVTGLVTVVVGAGAVAVVGVVVARGGGGEVIVGVGAGRVVVVGGGAVGRVLVDTPAVVVVALASVVLVERRTAVVDETRAEGTIVPPAREILGVMTAESPDISRGAMAVISGWIRRTHTTIAQVSAIPFRITVRLPTHDLPGALLALATSKGHSMRWKSAAVQFRATVERGQVLDHTVRPRLTTR